ncbi:MAG: hypothetical protein JSR46_07775 [Verrucomicrobia bacterium]|nr:hypothetical protein [Verrucomicrobiota bacterium]
MIELWETLQEAKKRAIARGHTIDVEIPLYSPAILPFCAGNAPRLLEKAFESVAVTKMTNKIYVHEQLSSKFEGISGPEFVVQYLKSLDVIQASQKANKLPEAFFDAIREIISEAIARDGVFTISRCEVLYDCSEPKRTRATQTLQDASQKV